MRYANTRMVTFGSDVEPPSSLNVCRLGHRGDPNKALPKKSAMGNFRIEDLAVCFGASRFEVLEEGQHSTIVMVEYEHDSTEAESGDSVRWAGQ
jgi:hypothetical protein